MVERSKMKYMDQKNAFFKSSKMSFIAPMIFIGAFLIIFGILFFVIHHRANVEQEREIRILAERTVKNIELKLSGNLDFIKLIARERSLGSIKEETFQSHVKHYLSDHKEFINITWVDSDFVIKTVSPLEGNAHIIGLHIDLPEPKRVSNLARKNKESVYTKPFEAIQSNSSFEVWVPVYKGNKFLGLLAGVYSCSKILNQSFPSGNKALINLVDENNMILTNITETPLSEKVISFVAPLTSIQNGMKVKVYMQKAPPFTWVMDLLIFIGIFLLFGFSFSLWKIRREMQMRHKIQESLRANETKLKKQNEDYLALNEELTESNIRIQHVNQEVIEAKEKAEESDRLKTAFLQNMSHEIRTPMNAIMGFSSLMMENYNNKSKLEKFSEIINQRCNDLLDIINDILDIAKIESGQLQVNPEECHIGKLFDELTEFFSEYKSKIGKQHIILSLHDECLQNEKIIIIDKVKLKQILINLINNAFKFTESGKIEGGCKYDENHHLLFYVSDTGIGIPKDKHTVVFERFSQLNENAKKNNGGTGLGLPIVKGLVHLLGGEIFLESEQGVGSTFSFTISYETANGSEKPVSQAEIPDLKKVGERTILIVEDDIYNAEYLKEILTRYKVKVLHAETGKEAVRVIQSQRVDLVLMDIRLPDIDGYEATRQILKYNPYLKILAQTAYASPDERHNALNAGCKDYISKPINKEVLLSMINSLLENND